jgi:hypothetical protein
MPFSTFVRRGLTGALVLLVTLSTGAARAADILEAGSGWQDTGAIEGTLEWSLRIQGSRKDIPIYAGWRHLGETRVYWAPYGRVNYTNFWSIGGGGNLLGVTVAPAGLELTPEQRVARWFATIELNFGSVQVGGNATPNAPMNPRIPDPNAYRALLRSEVQQTGGVEAASVISQNYPLGSYTFVTLATPIQIRAWKMLTATQGIGLFVEGDPMRLEWNIGRGGSSVPAYGYSVTAGLSVLFF